MIKNILYILLGTVFSFVNPERVRATSLSDETGSFSYEQNGRSRTVVKLKGADHLPPIGPGEIALIKGYNSAGLSINLDRVRGLMSWTQGSVKGFIAEARCTFGIYSNYAKDLYNDYKPVYDTILFAWQHGSEKGESIFVNEAVSKFNMDPDYAKALFNEQKPDSEPENILQESSAVHQTAPTIVQHQKILHNKENLQKRLADVLVSNIMNSSAHISSASSASSSRDKEAKEKEIITEEKEQSFENSQPLILRKPSTGLRHRKAGSPGSG